MPKYLIIAATKQEIEPLLDYFKINTFAEEGFFLNNSTIDVSVIITGVGMVNTAYNIGRYSHDAFDYVINVGICGAFNHNLKIGEVVTVVEDTLSEMGAENDTTFIKYADLNLPGKTIFQQELSVNNALLNNLKKVRGITVNTVHGNDESIKKTQTLFNADVESMEGAAFYRASDGLSENCFQIRSISNYVEKRDKSKWNIPLAISNLNNFIIQLIIDLEK